MYLKSILILSCTLLKFTDFALANEVFITEPTNDNFYYDTASYNSPLGEFKEVKQKFESLLKEGLYQNDKIEKIALLQRYTKKLIQILENPITYKGLTLRDGIIQPAYKLIIDEIEALKKRDDYTFDKINFLSLSGSKSKLREEVSNTEAPSDLFFAKAYAKYPYDYGMEVMDALGEKLINLSDQNNSFSLDYLNSAIDIWTQALAFYEGWQTKNELEKKHFLKKLIYAYFEAGRIEDLNSLLLRIAELTHDSEAQKFAQNYAATLANDEFNNAFFNFLSGKPLNEASCDIFPRMAQIQINFIKYKKKKSEFDGQFIRSAINSKKEPQDQQKLIIDLAQNNEHRPLIIELLIQKIGMIGNWRDAETQLPMINLLREIGDAEDWNKILVNSTPVKSKLYIGGKTENIPSLGRPATIALKELKKLGERGILLIAENLKKDNHFTVEREIAMSLAEMGKPAIPILIKSLGVNVNDSDNEKSAQDGISKALIRIIEKNTLEENEITLLLGALENSNPSVRKSVISILIFTKTYSPSLIEKLKNTLADPNPNVQIYAAYALSHCNVFPKKAIDLLIGDLGQYIGSGYFDPIQALIKAGPPAVEGLTKALESKEPYVHDRATYILKQIADKKD